MLSCKIVMSKPKAWRRTKQYGLLLGGVGVPLGIFAVLAQDVVEDNIISFDVPILYFFHNLACASMDYLMAGITYAGSALCLATVSALIVSLLLRNRAHPASAFFLFSFYGAALLNQITKQLFARNRPNLWISPHAETSYSFPSGHAMNSMAFCLALLFIAWPTKWRIHALVFSVIFVPLVGVSRLYWGVHYPSDIIAGWAAATCWVCAVRYFSPRSLRLSKNSDNKVTLT